MGSNLLDGWLALAAETKRVDRLSSSLGLDSPASQNSPSSMGSSSGSSGLNTPSLNAFRFLPFLNDVSPELLKGSSLKLGRHGSSLSRERSFSHLSPFPSRAQSQRKPSPIHSVDSSIQSDWRKRRNTSQAIISPKAVPSNRSRPSIQNNRHVSYPAWPSPKPIPLTINVPLKYGGNSEALPVEPTDYKPSLPYSQRNLAPRFPPGLGHGQGSNPPVSPMLSEPFHRLIVKDEEEYIDLSSDPILSHGTSMDDDEEMKPVPEEEEEQTDWWEHDAMNDFTFEFETATSYAPKPSKPWPIAK